MSRHFAAENFDCDDMDPFEGDAPPEPDARFTQRPVRTRATRGGGAPEETRFVECPFRDSAPSLEKCIGCEHWRGYSRELAGQGFVVSCARPDAHGPWPMPPHASNRSRAMRTPASALMDDPTCVRPDASLPEVAAALLERGSSGLPVVDTGGRAVGLIASSNLVATLASGVDLAGPAASPKATTARELMTASVPRVSMESSIAEVASIMSDRRLDSLPVVSRSGEVVGVVSTLALARWLAAPSQD